MLISNLRKLCILVFSVILFRCATTNYYTAQTLDQGQTVLTPGVDNLLLIVDNEGIIKKDFSFSPSLGIATGLPFRFETGIRSYFPYVLEANLRQQINPRTFKHFDISINGHMGVFISNELRSLSDPYFKYGLTLSKETGSVQPFISYYLNTNYAFKNETEKAINYSIVCFGIAFKHNQDLVIPEFNYYKSANGIKGILSFGIGIRACLRKKKTNGG